MRYRLTLNAFRLTMDFDMIVQLEQTSIIKI